MSARDDKPLSIQWGIIEASSLRYQDSEAGTLLRGLEVLSVAQDGSKMMRLPGLVEVSAGGSTDDGAVVCTGAERLNPVRR